MSQALTLLLLFTAKAIIIVLLIIVLLITFLLLIAKGKDKLHGRFILKHINKKFAETTELIYAETLPKKLFKQFIKEQKAANKLQNKMEGHRKNIFILDFNGDIKASAVINLREEVTAIINVAKPQDEVVVRLESGGGMVNGYGLAAAQLMRLKDKAIPLTITIDKIAASGGYMMACVANTILAAPFSIIGSIGVIVQLPNFNRLLKHKDIIFEQHTAGEYKRTITMFGENTDEGREKLQQELEDIHQLFKNLITTHRKQIDIKKVATGEHWLGQQALELQLVDKIKTSDDYLLERSKDAELYELKYSIKKPLFSKLSGATSFIKDKLSLGLVPIHDFIQTWYK
jgi:serine protease SohB